MKIQTLAEQATAYLDKNTDDSAAARLVPGLSLLRQTRPTELTPELYEPVLCLILQGRKETIFGDNALDFGPGESLLVSHDVPVIARITTASPEEPYLALLLSLDLTLFRSLSDEVGETIGDSNADARSAVVAKSDPRLLDCLSRYVALANDPLEAKVMASLLLRELHFRLLMAHHGGMLRELLQPDSHASSITRALARIRRDFRRSISVPELAKEIGMSPSSFHKHFKDITSVTPLQYQKELRLLEAKRLLSSTGDSVSVVAYEVGYQSPNQFSREFTRKFGAPPSSFSQLKVAGS